MAKLEPFGWVFTPSTQTATRIKLEPEPIVFCRDCVFHNVGENEVDSWNCCRLHSINVSDDEYCSWGVLREGTKPPDFEETRKKMYMEVREDG